jgi:hypothetical protein
MNTVGDLFNMASDSAMSMGFAFGSDAWWAEMVNYLYLRGFRF